MAKSNNKIVNITMSYIQINEVNPSTKYTYWLQNIQGVIIF